MKKLSYLFICLFACSSIFVSCSDDEDQALEISFANNENTTTLASGKTSYEINATISSTAGLKEVKWFVVSSGGEDQLGMVESFTNKNRYDFKQTFDAYEETVIKISATDKDNITTTRNFTIKVTATETPAGATVSIWPDRVLGAQSNATSGSSCASADGVVYLQAAAKANITKVDFIYFYQTGGRLAELVSPAKANLSWLPATGKNDTKYTETLGITDAQYNNITETNGSELIDGLVTDATATKEWADNLAAGNYVGFITQAGKKGIIKITSVTGTEAGSIKIDIKVKK